MLKKSKLCKEKWGNAMKKSVFTICTALVLSLVFGITMGEAATKKPTRYIGLHDRLLNLQDIRIIDNDMKVPLRDIAKDLYLHVEKQQDITHIRKFDIELSYDHTTKKTSKDGTELKFTSIVDIDGELFISVKDIASEIGFKVEYFKRIETLRIYRDDYVHMNAETYEIHIKKLLEEKHMIKPPAKPPVIKTPIKPPAKPPVIKTPIKPPAKPPVIKPPVKQLAKSKTTVYLTFDDGPNKYTTINNATLKKYNTQGSFFFLGKHMIDNETIVKAVAKNGHYIGTHSMTHDVGKVYKTTKTFIDEMNEGTKLIQQITGQNAKLLRVPYGSKPHVTPTMQKQLNKFGYKMWDWDVDSLDWKYTDKETDTIIQNIRTGVEKAYKSGDRNIIILLHDRNQTTKALPQIIEWLKKEGYTLKKYESDHHIIQNFLQDTTL